MIGARCRVLFSACNGVGEVRSLAEYGAAKTYTTVTIVGPRRVSLRRYSKPWRKRAQTYRC